MKKRLIDANHLKHRFEMEYGCDNSWYNLARTMAMIDAEPTQDERAVVIKSVIILGAIIVIAIMAAQFILTVM